MLTRFDSFISLTFLCLFLSSCLKLNLNKEFDHLSYLTKTHTCSDIVLQDPDCINPEFQAHIDSILKKGISRNDAVNIAIMNNKYLQAELEELGIAKAELVQAKLLTNPDLSSIFMFPRDQNKNNSLQPKIEVETLFTVSDLWQVPLKTRIFQDELEIASLKILDTIIHTIAMTRRAYDRVLFYSARYAITKQLLKETKELRKLFYARQRFGFNSDLENYLADIQVSKLAATLVLFETQYKDAHIELKKVLGLENPCYGELKLTNSLASIKLTIPNTSQLIESALYNQPELQVALLHVKRYEDTVAFEKARRFRDVKLGFEYQQEPDGLQIFGPALKLEVPLFDQNQAQIAKAYFNLQQAKKRFLAKKLDIEAHVCKIYNLLKAHSKQLAIYQHEIQPTIKKALEYTKAFTHTMQLSPIVMLQTKLQLYELKTQIAELTFDTLNSFTELEQTIGKRIDVFCPAKR